MEAGEVVSRFLNEVLKEVHEQRGGELHVTDIVGLESCERRFWFRKNEPVPPDVKSLLRMWKGKKLHETCITSSSEIPFEYEKVMGRVDEIHETAEKITVIDKKFVSFLPRNDRDVKKYYSHYITQVEIYSAMIDHCMSDDREYEAMLFFINTEEEPFFYVYAWKPHLEKAKQKLRELKERAWEILNSQEPPERNPEFQPAGYPCTYCDYVKRCWLNGRY